MTRFCEEFGHFRPKESIHFANKGRRNYPVWISYQLDIIIVITYCYDSYWYFRPSLQACPVQSASALDVRTSCFAATLKASRCHFGYSVKPYCTQLCLLTGLKNTHLNSANYDWMNRGGIRKSHINTTNMINMYQHFKIWPIFVHIQIRYLMDRALRVCYSVVESINNTPVAKVKTYVLLHLREVM